MLAATLEFDGGQHPVSVRNLSTSGALLEGRCLPVGGEDVVLHRDTQSIRGRVVWTSGNRCGVHFSALVSVEGLIKRPKIGVAAAAHQSRVDDIQRALRNKAPVPRFGETESLVGLAAVGKRAADEIGYAQRLVETVGEALSNDNYILTRYATVLQQLDEAEQLLRKLSNNLSAADLQSRQ